MKGGQGEAGRGWVGGWVGRLGCGKVGEGGVPSEEEGLMERNRGGEGGRRVEVGGHLRTLVECVLLKRGTASWGAWC